MINAYHLTLYSSSKFRTLGQTAYIFSFSCNNHFGNASVNRLPLLIIIQPKELRNLFLFCYQFISKKCPCLNRLECIFFLPIYNDCKARPLSTLISSTISKGCTFLFSTGCIHLRISITDISETAAGPLKKYFSPSLKAKDREYLSGFFHFINIKSFRPNPGKNNWEGIC